MTDVRVRAETPMLGLALGQVVTVTRSPLVEAAIAGGRFTVLDDEEGDPVEAPAGQQLHQLRGAALDAALTAHGLPQTGLAEAKRRRLARHLRSEHPAQVLAAQVLAADLTSTTPVPVEDPATVQSPTDDNTDDGADGDGGDPEPADR